MALLSHKLQLLALKIIFLARSVRDRVVLPVSKNKKSLALGALVCAFLIAVFVSRHFLLTFVPSQTVAFAKWVLRFVQANPSLSHTSHVFMNMVPDIAYLLLAFAGVSYLMPKLVKKIEKNKPIRATVITLFASFGLLAILVNAINRADQESKESELRGKLEKEGDKIDAVRDSIGKVQNFLVDSKGTLNEAERRKEVLQSLRDQYVIEHPDVPVTMITGNTWPPRPWMEKRLQELGEKFPFIPPEPVTPAQVFQPPPAIPPAIDLAVGISEKNEDVAHLTLKYKPKSSYIEQERACSIGFKCYPERDFSSAPIEITIGDKGWARVFFLIYNVGGSTVPHPTVEINVGSGRDVFVDRANQRQSHNQVAYSMVEFSPKETLDIVPFSDSRVSYEYPIDVSVGELSQNFTLLFRIFGDNLKSHELVIPFHIVRI